MKWEIIELSATLIQCFISTEFVTKYLGFKIRNKKSYIGFTIGFLMQVFATLILNQITIFEGIAGLIYPTIQIVYALFILNGSIYEKIIISCIDNVLKIIASASVFTIISYFSSLDVTKLMTQQSIERFIVIVMGLSTYLFFTRMLLRLQKNNKFALNLMEWVAILGVFITSFAAGVLVFEILISSPKSDKVDLYAVLVMTSFILINGLCYYIFVNISAKNKEKLQYTLMELRLKEQEKSLIEIKQSYEEIRKVRHDMKNYIECAATLLHTGKDIEAKDYLNNLLENKISHSFQYIYTKSDAVNAVLSSKIARCLSQKIHIDYEITGSVERIPELDLSILLANVMDNAIEASTELKEDADIFINIYDEKNYLVIQISNYIRESVLDKNPKLKTTKKDKHQHGIGSLSIRDIVKKHNGMMSIYEKMQHFYVDIWLRFD